jgi:hypothetical protein
MLTLKDDAGVIVQVPAVDKESGPSESKFQLVIPLTAGESAKTRPAEGVTLFDDALSAP